MSTVTHSSTIPGPQRGSLVGRRTAAWLFLAAVLGCSYFAGVRYLPASHGDELGLLDIPYRACTYGDMRYPPMWSQSFGSDQGRRYPPVSAFLVRCGFHRLVGFSGVSSRVFSGVLILAAVGSALWLVGRIGKLRGWQAWLSLVQIGLTPVIIYSARTVRFEQEVFFLGWLGVVMIPLVISLVDKRAVRQGLWLLAGAITALAATSHPFGMVYPAVLGVWLVLFRRDWQAIDGCGFWRRSSLVAFGVAIGTLPTVVWLARDWENTVAFTQQLNKVYAERESEMIAWLAAMPTWKWLNDYCVPSVAARLNALDAAAYLDYVNYPVGEYRWRGVLHAWFYVELLLVWGYFLRSLCLRFRNANPWVHLVVLLAVGFTAFNLFYPPSTTYGLYPSFYVTLAGVVILWRIVAAQTSGTIPTLLRWGVVGAFSVVPLVMLHYSGLHLAQLAKTLATRELPNTPVDTEFAAIRQVAEKLGLPAEDKYVYTSSESWIAAGRRQCSLYESTMLGLCEPVANHHGAVFKNPHLEFFLQSSGANSSGPFPNRQRRLERLRVLLEPLQLSGLLTIESSTDAYSFYVRSPGAPTTMTVARIMRDASIEHSSAALVREIVPTAQESGAPSYALAVEPGDYLLCVWMADDQPRRQLEVRLQTGQTTRPDTLPHARMPLGSMNTVVPASLYLNVPEGVRGIDVTIADGSKLCPVARASLYRVKPGKETSSGSARSERLAKRPAH